MQCEFCNKYNAQGWWHTKPCCRECWKIKKKEQDNLK